VGQTHGMIFSRDEVENIVEAIVVRFSYTGGEVCSRRARNDIHIIRVKQIMSLTLYLYVSG
jgi:hypothetical protein